MVCEWTDIRSLPQLRIINFGDSSKIRNLGRKCGSHLRDWSLENIRKICELDADAAKTISPEAEFFSDYGSGNTELDKSLVLDPFGTFKQTRGTGDLDRIHSFDSNRPVFGERAVSPNDNDDDDDVTGQISYGAVNQDDSVATTGTDQPDDRKIRVQRNGRPSMQHPTRVYGDISRYEN